MIYELVVGALFGFLVGWVSVGLIRRVALGSAGLYPLAIVSLAFISYAGGTVLLHVSGFAAVYVTSLVLGRAELPHRMATRSFVDGIAWLAQIGLFVMLGLLASPGRIGAERRPGRAGDRDRGHRRRAVRSRSRSRRRRSGCRGRSRPSSPGPACAAPSRSCWRRSRWPNRCRRQTGIFDVVFVLVLLFTLLQGPSLPWLAKRLGVLDDNAATRSTSTSRRWSRWAPTCCRSRSRASPAWPASRSASSASPPASRSRW